MIGVGIGRGSAEDIHLGIVADAVAVGVLQPHEQEPRTGCKVAFRGNQLNPIWLRVAGRKRRQGDVPAGVLRHEKTCIVCDAPPNERSYIDLLLGKIGGRKHELALHKRRITKAVHELIRNPIAGQNVLRKIRRCGPGDVALRPGIIGEAENVRLYCRIRGECRPAQSQNGKLHIRQINRGQMELQQRRAAVGGVGRVVEDNQIGLPAIIRVLVYTILNGRIIGSAER